MKALAAAFGALTLLATTAAGATTAAAQTPDQKFAAALAGARLATTSAMRRLKALPPTIDDVAKARSDLAVARSGLGTARALVGLTVGGAQNEAVSTGLAAATAQTARALRDLKRADYSAARTELAAAQASSFAALEGFGVPLAKEFQAFAVYRNLSNIYGFEEYLGLTARVGEPITKIVVGLAGREAANAGEPGAKPRTPAIPIMKMALYTLQEPSGAFSSGWCRLVNGILVCKLNRTMEASETFAVAFGPRVAAGTTFLVKFWSADGRRSHAVFTTR